MEFTIRKGTIKECIACEKQIAEFDYAYPEEEYSKRFKDTYFSIFVAEIDRKIAGYKVGYQKGDFFYSWLGGVIPAYRRKGIAKALAKKQEQDCRDRGIEKIRFKTYLKYDKMLRFALKNHFTILSEDKRTGKLVLEKKL